MVQLPCLGLGETELAKDVLKRSLAMPTSQHLPEMQHTEETFLTISYCLLEVFP